MTSATVSYTHLDVYKRQESDIRYTHLDTGSSTRIALYQLFTKIWNSVALNGKSSGGDVNEPVERHLAQISPMPRQAFLLVALEGLSEDDAPKVLDIDVQTPVSYTHLSPMTCNMGHKQR